LWLGIDIRIISFPADWLFMVGSRTDLLNRICCQNMVIEPQFDL